MSKKFLSVLSVAVAVIAILGSYQFPQVKQAAQTTLGAVTGPDFYFEYFGVNDVRTYPKRQELVGATTTPCAIKSPAATTTLVAAHVRITVGSSTATTWTVAKATTGFATTTYLDSFSVGSGAQGTLWTEATTTGVDIKQVVAPNSYIVWGRAGTTEADATKFKGVCEAVFLR